MLGGTQFVGRAVTEAALARGWEVTVFHRGHHAPPPGTAELIGDRTAGDGLAALAAAGAPDGGGPTWDLVVDTWSGAPSAVRDAARLLTARAARYTYISSRSVYDYPAPAGLTEDGPLVGGASPDAGDGESYALAKRGGELAALDAFGDRALLARAGLILGPWENIGRLPWWLNRIARGGPVLAPGTPDTDIQYIDVRDLAGWVLDAAERGLHGPYNLVSRPGHTTMGGLLDACVRATGSGAELRWTPAETILAAGVEPWTDLPVWLPPGELYDILHQGDVGLAYAAGLRCRPVAETVTDTWTWLCGLGGTAPHRPDRPATGLDPETEAKLLAG
ncbi:MULTISPECIES: NAD-dependent epimerase/dehydratase family protein [unclassified Streptomyces]|uniref:NAD-dependent epimerase/dehydratase family protein n=1 Tax=unclassified Streptomyces TaxID=2593676 RepID=UPI000DAC2341|nr:MULTISPECIES: NAD-dependent epimerase/dehydratase family protein [unclassified Streptomyces]PZT76591.1 reductase [Streptomyces sp. AC1-42W]PZT80591.1 reductase [Streptomyces sp. AC1-42T]